MYLDMPNEFRLANGKMLLEHAKVIQKSVYEHQHVTHEGHLRIIFTPELKVCCLVWGCTCHLFFANMPISNVPTNCGHMMILVRALAIIIIH
jgi:hypothetical protein